MHPEPRPIYLDHQATTPLDERVLDAMLPYLRGAYGNPASAQHALGQQAERALSHAREQVADLVGARRGEVVFCSGATEANNLAIHGVTRLSARRRIVTVATEHAAVLEPVAGLVSSGFDVCVLGVDRDGRFDRNELEDAVDQNTALVSIAAANNEIGTLHDLAPVAEIAHSEGAMLHTDAAQATGKIALDVEPLGVDLMSISAHKMYGPKGAGALIVRAPVSPMIRGGGQEGGLRSGTVNVAGCVGLGLACELAAEEMDEEAIRLRVLSTRALRRLQNESDAQLNGPRERLPGNLNVRLPGVEADALMARCPELAIAAGSACSSATPTPSHVLLAIGLGHAEAEESVRIGIGRSTSIEEIDRACSSIATVAEQIRKIAAHA